jgi:hypothetical protein
LKLTTALVSSCLLFSGCSKAPAPEVAVAGPAPAIQDIHAELIASDPSWGNTEGPAVDSKNNLCFCSRGTWKGIVRTVATLARVGTRPH